MKKLLIILCETPFHSDKVDQTINIAEAAISKKHEVSVFLFMDGVYN
ncbi:sulfur reduction protein DsrE, partial [Candidatus Bathyarchaeota archaeon]